MTEAEIVSAYEWNTGNVIVERFDALDYNHVPAVLVHGHGPFTWGESGAKAVEIAQALEIVAEMAIKSLMIERYARPLDEVLQRKHFFRKHGSSAYYGQNKADESLSLQVSSICVQCEDLERTTD